MCSCTTSRQEVWPQGSCGCLGDYIVQGRNKQGTKKTGRRPTGCYAALVIGLAPDYPGLRGREKPELYQTCESREVKRIEDDLVPWDSPDENHKCQEESWNYNDKVLWDCPILYLWKYRIEEKLKLFSTLRWPCTRLMKVEKQGETKMIQCFEVALY